MVIHEEFDVDFKLNCVALFPTGRWYGAEICAILLLFRCPFQ